MNSFRCVDFEPREGVESAINNYLSNTLQTMVSPQTSRLTIRRNNSGFTFTLIMGIQEKNFSRYKFVSFSECKLEPRNWQVAVVDLLTRDILHQYRLWMRKV